MWLYIVLPVYGKYIISSVNSLDKCEQLNRKISLIHLFQVT